MTEPGITQYPSRNRSETRSGCGLDWGGFGGVSDMYLRLAVVGPGFHTHGPLWSDGRFPSVRPCMLATAWRTMQFAYAGHHPRMCVQ